MANIHRRLAADYSELAYQVSRNVCHYRAQLAKKPKWGTKVRWTYRSFLRREQSKLVAYAEQVELHLEDAITLESSYNYKFRSRLCTPEERKVLDAGGTIPTWNGKDW